MSKQKWILNMASMTSKNIFVPGFSFSWYRQLRRTGCTEQRRSVHRSVLSSTKARRVTQGETKGSTLVRSVRDSTTHPCPSLLRFARNDEEGMQTHSPRFSKPLLFLLQ